MSFATELLQSTSQLRVLVEIDVADPNAQWVNAGAGIWYVSATNLYPEVGTGDNLGSAFTAQNFGAIGSVRSDGIPLTRVSSLAALTDTVGGFYYDSAARELFVCLTDYDEPSLHRVTIGVIYGYTGSGYVPTGGPGLYEGRLLRNPTVSASRDPLFFGRITFRSGQVELANGDGEFDTFAIDNDVYGNEARVKLGFDDIDYDDYVTLFTGYVEGISISETACSITITDKRKQLTKPIQYTCTAKNACDAIVDVLNQAYGYTYDDRFYDTLAWAAAEAVVDNVTLNMQEPEPAIDVIEDITASAFGLFYLTADGKFAFKFVDEDATISRLIPAADILNHHAISYDPSQVVSSVRVGYDKNWLGGTAFTYYPDTSREATVYAAYKTYNQRTFDTLLPTLSAATAFATTVLDRSTTVRGEETIVVPLEYYDLQLGDIIGLEIQRGEQPMIGSRKAEITGVRLTLDTPTVELTIRHGAEIEDIRETEAGDIRITEDDEIRMVG